ncbi:MAG: hypothetical protein K1X72_26705 [Pyrinomonadaceae bacterium]|nr:hypothetical protein [Pyrinomonadaceae bacterium]
MNKTEYQIERKVAEVQGNSRLNNGLNWAIISFGIIILTIIITAVIFMTPIPRQIEKTVNSNVNANVTPR